MSAQTRIICFEMLNNREGGWCTVGGGRCTVAPTRAQHTPPPPPPGKQKTDFHLDLPNQILKNNCYELSVLRGTH